MKDTPVQEVHAHNSSPNVIRHRDHLKEGSPVLVRIIASRGNGKYEASVAGGRIILSSAKDLQPGDTFTGKIGIRNGFITINPDSSLPSGKEIITANILETGNLFDPVSSPALASLLAGLNLPPDNLSFKILLQFKQLGMKLDSRTMNRIRKEAEKSPDPEKKLEELVNRAQKRVTRITGGNPGFEGQQSSGGQSSGRQKEETPEEKSLNEPENTSELPNTWLSEVKSFMKTVLSGNLSNEPAELTVLNHLGFYKDKTSENSWITIPFEITNPFEETASGKGKILLLMGSSDKNLKQINIHAEYSGSEYHFAVFTKPGTGKINRIAFNKSDCLNEKEECENLSKTFMTMGKPVTVEFVPPGKIRGFATGLEDFATAEGTA